MSQSNLETIVGTRFVNRLPELDLVCDMFEDVLQERSTLKRVANFHGVRGIGKTWLIRHLYDLAQNNQQATLLMDFGMFNTHISADQQCAKVAESILDQMESFDSEAVANQARRVRECLSDGFTAALRDLLIQAISDSPILLLFDATEQADDSTLNWLENEIIAPLLQTDKVAIALAGRKSVSWQRFDVNRRVIAHQLEPFDSETVGAQIPSYAFLASQITGVTFGHPLANDQLARNLLQIEREEEIVVNREYFEHHKKQLLQHLVEELIDNQVMADVETDVHQAIKIVSALRYFDINALRYFLVHFAPSKFKDKPGMYFLNLIGKMVDSGLVGWNPRRKGYALYTTIRRMMFLHKYHSDPDAFIQMNWAASELYALWIKRLPENRVSSIIENLFHIANAMSAQGENPKEITFRLSGELQRYLEDYSKTEFGLGGIMSLREELRADREFGELVPIEPQRLDKIISAYVRVQEEE